jgi:hypothetical protein
MGGHVRHTPTYRRPRHDSNAQPSDPKSDALSIELRGRMVNLAFQLYLNIDLVN